MPLLDAITFHDPGPEKRDLFPFGVPAIRASLDLPVQFEAPVTFFVGENGSGKSTVLEGIACAVALPGIGADDPSTDPTLVFGQQLAEIAKLRWRLRHPHRGYFLRAEDFFGFARRMDRLKAELRADARAMREEKARSDYARGLGAGVLDGQARAIEARYGEAGLDAASHGEQFLDLFSKRCWPGGLYLLDEPEAPLSPSRQLTFLSMLKTRADEGAQFIIATHSPILMALPGAKILSFDHRAIRPVAYESLEHVQIMRSFLDDPDAYLRHL